MVVTLPLPQLNRAHIRRTVRELGARAGKALRPLRAPLRNLASCPLTVAGIACIDASVCMWIFKVGLAVTGVSLILLEHIIADEE